jgi:hypothetical protein
MRYTRRATLSTREGGLLFLIGEAAIVDGFGLLTYPPITFQSKGLNA